MPQVNGSASLLINRRFLATAGGSSFAVVIACALAPLPVQLAVVGVITSVALGILFSRRENNARIPSDLIQQSFFIAKDEELQRHHEKLTRSLAKTVEHGDPLFRSLANKRIAAMASEAEEIAEGAIVYEDTETWRLAYEQLLRSPGLHLYRSVALVTSSAYWQDEPGRQSMRLNYEMAGKGTLSIERTAIIADDLWPANEYLPLQPLRAWIDEQHNHGIWLRLVRFSALLNEPDLQADFGIYGSRAVGIQELSPYSSALRFILSFDFNRVREAEDRWERLAVYASSYRDLLDRPELNL
jgi:hypothetical protein